MSFCFSEKSLFCRIQYGRCVRGFWRQILVYTLLIYPQYVLKLGVRKRGVRPPMPFLLRESADELSSSVPCSFPNSSLDDQGVLLAET